MTDLLTRLAARTLAPAPGLRPVAAPRFAPDPHEEEGAGESLVAPVRSAAAEARPTEAAGPRDRTPAPPREVDVPPSGLPEPASASMRRPSGPRAPTQDQALAPAKPAGRPEPPADPASSTDRRVERAREAAEPPRPARRPPPAPDRRELGLVPRAPASPAPPRGSRMAPRPEAWGDPPLVRRSSSEEDGGRGLLPVTPHVTGPGRAMEPREETTVLVSIGRIEVRGPEQRAPVAAPAPWTEGPMLSLGDYLQRRGGSS